MSDEDEVLGVSLEGLDVGICGEPSLGPLELLFGSDSLKTTGHIDCLQMSSSGLSCIILHCVLRKQFTDISFHEAI